MLSCKGQGTLKAALQSGTHPSILEQRSGGRFCLGRPHPIQAEGAVCPHTCQLALKFLGELDQRSKCGVVFLGPRNTEMTCGGMAPRIAEARCPKCRKASYEMLEYYLVTRIKPLSQLA